MHDGHCTCGGLYSFVSDSGRNIQQWVCQNKDCKWYNRVVYRPYNQCEIYQTYQEAETACQIKKSGV
jgi:hypothetical protein